MNEDHPIVEMNRLYKSNEFNWEEVNLRDLPPSTAKYVFAWLVSNKINFKLATQKPGGNYIFLIDHPIVRYLIHIPANNVHMWGDVNFENLDNNNNKALASLATKEVEENAKIRRIFDLIDNSEAN